MDTAIEAQIDIHEASSVRRSDNKGSNDTQSKETKDTAKAVDASVTPQTDNEAAAGSSEPADLDGVSRTIEQLSFEIERRYSDTTRAIQDMIHTTDKGLELNLPVDNEVTSRAQEYLEKLDANLETVESRAKEYLSNIDLHKFDANLETVESRAKEYWSKIDLQGASGLWGRFTNSVLSAANFADKNTQGAETDADHKKYLQRDDDNTESAINRTKLELKQLSNDPKLYTDNKLDLLEDFMIQNYAKEAADLLKVDNDLATLKDSLVPSKLDEKKFWQIYFSQRVLIFERENRRKNILADARTNESEIKWDDEDDDEEENEDGGENEIEDDYEHDNKELPEKATNKFQSEDHLKDTHSKSDAKIKTTTTTKKHVVESERDDDEEEDDDWE